MFVLPRLTQSFAWLLAAALLLTQTFAAVHAVVHADRHSHGHSQEYPQEHLQQHSQEHSQAELHKDCGGSHHHSAGRQAEGNFSADFFPLHQEESDCRLFDQASHDGVVAKLAAALLPFAPPPFAVALFQGNALARWAALFDARGPPLTL